MEALVRNIYLDYNSISLRLDVLANKIMDADFGALVIILRGGSFVGLHMSFLTDMPVYFLRYDRFRAKVEWVGETPQNRRILLCEDFAGYGKTLIDCRRFLSELGYEVSTLVVCKDYKSATVPDYYCFDLQDTTARFILPWERVKINPNVDLDEKIQGSNIDQKYERTAWDMDGIFLDDIDSGSYRTDLDKTLFVRDQSSLACYAPTPSPRDIIITGRPVCDKIRTEWWLRKNNINIPVVFRDDQIEYPSVESVARWKGKRAIELGFTHYVESQAEQALFLASIYPELRVIWWNQGRPTAVQAYESKKAEQSGQLFRSHA